MSPTSRRLLVVSNRLPVVLERTPAGWALKGGSGGLVSALAPVLSHRGGLWIGWPGLALEKGGDWEGVIEGGFRERGYDLVPVLLSEEEVRGFYEGFSNAVLWPLFHDLVSSCDFEPSFWYSYLDVNKKFADAVVEQSRADDFVWVQDYQLIHVAEFVGERVDRQIGFFLHIPFPPLDPNRRSKVAIRPCNCAIVACCAAITASNSSRVAVAGSNLNAITDQTSSPAARIAPRL